MWPFDRKVTEPVLSDERAAREAGAELEYKRLVEKIEGDVKLLTDAVAKHAKRVDQVEMEWSEWFDKFRRLYARIAKRQERDEKLEAETSREDAPQSTNGFAEVSQHGGPRAPRRNY